MKLVEITDRAAWDSFVNASPNGHPLQLWGWGEAKRANGWTPHRLALMDGEQILSGAQVLLWPIPKLGKQIAYVPRGPVCEPKANGELLGELAAWAKAQGALYLRIEPAWTEAKLPKGWVKAANHVQLPETATIDLVKTEDELLGAMERKHRQYINKSEREGVQVQRVTGDSLDAVWPIYVDTAARAGFGLHERSYYDELYRVFGGNNYLYVATVDGQAAAFLWLVAGSKTAYELYGGVTAAGQAARANYILKWTAMRELKAAGYGLYDFNGRLNEGVSKFKEGFGPDETDWIGTWDYPFNKSLYQLWERLWPLAKPIGRRLMKTIKR